MSGDNTKLVIRSFHCSDADLWSWAPEADREVYLPVTLEIGEMDVKGADNFSVMIATPEALAHHGKSRGELVVEDRGLLVVLEFDWNVIRRRLEQIVESCAAPTWSQSVIRLQRFFRWEYEDYTTESEADR